VEIMARKLYTYTFESKKAEERGLPKRQRGSQYFPTQGAVKYFLKGLPKLKNVRIVKASRTKTKRLFRQGRD
jgi:hypothetical protein